VHLGLLAWGTYTVRAEFVTPADAVVVTRTSTYPRGALIVARVMLVGFGVYIARKRRARRRVTRPTHGPELVVVRDEPSTPRHASSSRSPAPSPSTAPFRLMLNSEPS
jgi:hypothetical protein